MISGVLARDISLVRRAKVGEAAQYASGEFPNLNDKVFHVRGKKTNVLRVREVRRDSIIVETIDQKCKRSIVHTEKYVLVQVKNKK